MTDETKVEPTPTAADTQAGAPLAPSADSGRPAGLPETELARLTDEVIGALKTVYDPEIPADIYEIGLVYKIDIADDRAVTVDMTLTTPNCPSAQELPVMVENGRQRGGRRRGQGQHRVGSALGSEPDVG